MLSAMPATANPLSAIPPAEPGDLPPAALALPGRTPRLAHPDFAPPPCTEHALPCPPLYLYDWMALHSPRFVALRRAKPGAPPPPPGVSPDTDDTTYARWVPRIHAAASYVLHRMGLPSERAARQRLVPGILRASPEQQQQQQQTSNGGSGPAAAEAAARSPMPPILAVCAHVDNGDYLTVALGTQRAGVVSLELATNNSADAIANLIYQAGARHLLVGRPGAKVDLDNKIQQALHILRTDHQWEVQLVPWPTALDEDKITAHPNDWPSLLPTGTTEGSMPPYTPDRPVAILHSSGTTGLWPKLRVLTERFVRQIQLWPLYARPPAHDGEGEQSGKADDPTRSHFVHGFEPGATFFMGNLPPFHAMGRQLSWAALSAGLTLGLYEYQESPRPVEERSWVAAILRSGSTGVVAPPSMYRNALTSYLSSSSREGDDKNVTTQNASQEEDPEDDGAPLRGLRRVSARVYGGALLPADASAALDQEGVHVSSFFGCTEVATMTAWGQSVPDPVLAVCPQANALCPMAHAFLRPLPSDTDAQDSPSSQHHNNPWERWEVHANGRIRSAVVEMLWYGQGLFQPTISNGTYRGVPTFSTGDRYHVFVRSDSWDKPRPLALGAADDDDVQPTISTDQLPPGAEVFYGILGRFDDTIALANGEKVNPGALVHTLTAHPDIDHALVFGATRPYPGVLVQLSPKSRLLASLNSTQPTADQHRDWDQSSLTSIRDAIWPSVAKANAAAPAHAQIRPEMVLIAHPSKPFLLTGKGSVRTARTLWLYTDLVDGAYAKEEEQGETEAGAEPEAEISLPARADDWTESTALRLILEILHQVRGDNVPTSAPASEQQAEANIDPDADLFQTLGVDSISAGRVRTLLVAHLAKWSTLHGDHKTNPGSAAGEAAGFWKKKIGPSFVYENSTPMSLARTVLLLLQRRGLDAALHGGRSAEQRMLDIIHKYTQSWPVTPAVKGPKQEDGLVFVVTGTTGSLGSNVLIHALPHPQVRKVYALNRPSSSSKPLKERQASTLVAQGGKDAAALVDHPKLFLLSADCTTEQSLRESLGMNDRLTQSQTQDPSPSSWFDEISQTVTHIIHAAWRLDFNIPVQSFEAQISSVRTLADLALRSPARAPHPARMIFLSSVARVMGGTNGSEGSTSTTPTTTTPKDIRSQGKDAPVLETAEEEDLPLSLAQGGYGQSKAVAERTLLAAHEQGQADTVVLRAGQLCGNTLTGAWNTSEWFPALVQASQALGTLPVLPGQADWLPLDFAAASALDVSLSASVPGRIMHLTNPSRAEMADLMPLFARELNLTLTTPSAWFNKLVALGEKLGDERGPQMVPALRLLPFFAEMTGGSLDKAGEAERAPTPIPVMPVRKTLDASATLRSCPAVGADNVARWVSFWRKEGLLA